MSDVDLIEVMGEATRYESTSIAQRLLAVAELFVRRSGELAECEWRCADACDAVAAEVSAVQNISHARAVSQVQLGCALRHRLPAVARSSSTLSVRAMIVDTIRKSMVPRRNTLMPRLDEAIARHAEKWMKLSVPKLRDRVDLWVAKFDPAAVRVPPKVDGRRFVEFQPGSAPGLADFWGTLRARRRGDECPPGCIGGHRVR